MQLGIGVSAHRAADNNALDNFVVLFVASGLQPSAGSLIHLPVIALVVLIIRLVSGCRVV